MSEGYEVPPGVTVSPDELVAMGARKAIEQMAIGPIPLSERKPGPGDCDDRGRCWCFDPLSWTHNELVLDPHDREHRFVREVDGPSWELRPPESGDTHWLPAGAQFLPARVEG